MRHNRSPKIAVPPNRSRTLPGCGSGCRERLRTGTPARACRSPSIAGETLNTACLSQRRRDCHRWATPTDQATRESWSGQHRNARRYSYRDHQDHCHRQVTQVRPSFSNNATSRSLRPNDAKREWLPAHHPNEGFANMPAKLVVHRPR
ncbi:hypothetical protein D3C75_759620 [compost metagenome]